MLLDIIGASPLSFIVLGRQCVILCAHPDLSSRARCPAKCHFHFAIGVMTSVFSVIHFFISETDIERSSLHRSLNDSELL